MNGKFLENINKHNLIKSGEKIFVGVSGGCDSMFLLNNLIHLRDELNFQMCVLHLNHMVRDEAADDENFVKDYCKAQGVEFISEQKDMNLLAKERGLSPEDAGRVLRYEFFRKNANGCKIFLAHNADDQVETVLQRIVRGTGIDGLSAMDFVSGDIVRPILNISRAEIEDYVEKNQIPFVHDKTNDTLIYERNMVRNVIIPKLKELNPNVGEAIFRLSDSAMEESNYLDGIARNVYEDVCSCKGLNISKLLLEDPVIVRRVFKIFIQENFNSTKGIYKVHYDMLLDFLNSTTGKSLDLPGGKVIVNNYGYLNFVEENIKEKTNLKPEVLNLGKNFTNYGAFTLSKGYRDVSADSVNIDFDKVKGSISIRYRKNGDAFIPLGMKGIKKLKDFFIDEKVVKDLRDIVPIITDEEKILWVCGYRMSDEVKITGDTENILNLRREK